MFYKKNKDFPLDWNRTLKILGSLHILTVSRVIWLLSYLLFNCCNKNTLTKVTVKETFNWTYSSDPSVHDGMVWWQERWGLTSYSTSSRRRESPGNGKESWNLEARTQWHTCSNMATFPNPSQTVSGTGTLRYEFMGPVLIQTITVVIYCPEKVSVL